MASIITHAAAAVALGRLYTLASRPARFWALAAASAVLPDADVITFHFGIPYEHMLGHRGISHSLAFALALGLLCGGLLEPKARWRGAALLFATTASHGLLDALTNGGLGVAFFAPFSAERYFLPWQPIVVSPISIPAFIGRRGVKVLASEFVVVWIPLALALWLRLKLGLKPQGGAARGR